MTPRAAVISRVPRPGQTKRRLARAIGDRAAAALHIAFVHDELAALRHAGVRAILAHERPGPGELETVESLAAGAPRLPLPGADLASDLLAAFRALCPDGEPAAVVASDVPHLSGAAVARALRLLDGSADVVLGPSPDGGYWMIALRAAHDLFTGIPMGTSDALAATERRAAALGLRVARAEPVRDVDDLDDLTALAPHLPVGGRTRAVLAEVMLGCELELPLPRRLHLEITNRCNSACVTCVRTTAPEPTAELTLTDVERITDGLPLETVALQVNGEGTLHPELPAIIALLAARGVTVELNTNAIALRGARADVLRRSGLAALHVSMDGATPHTYDRLRGIDVFDRVVANVAAFTRARTGARPRVTLWMTATRHNLHELPALVDLAAGVGADEVYLQRLVYFGRGLARAGDSVHGELTAADRDAIADAERRAAAHGIALRASGGHTAAAMLELAPDAAPWRACRRPWESAVVMADGDVVPCCIATFVSPRHAIRAGNVLRESWREVWNSPGYRRQRAALLAGRAPEVCRRCGVCWSL